MMDAVRAYRWGTWFFALISIGGLALLPFALNCCAAFSRWEFAHRASLADVLLDWPLQFRLFLLTLVAALISAAAMIVMLLAARREARANASDHVRAFIIRAALSSFVVGVLYIPMFYATHFFGVGGGPHNLLWMLGIPTVLAWMGWPRRSRLAWGALVVLGGWVCLGILSVSVGIPLD